MDPMDNNLAEALAGLIALSEKYVESHDEEHANAHHNVAPYYGYGIGDYEYEVGKIVDYRSIDGCDYYLVHWKGYGIKGRTWEPHNNLMNAPKKIDEFFQKHFWKQNNR